HSPVIAEHLKRPALPAVSLAAQNLPRFKRFGPAPDPAEKQCGAGAPAHGTSRLTRFNIADELRSVGAAGFANDVQWLPPNAVRVLLGTLPTGGCRVGCPIRSRLTLNCKELTHYYAAQRTASSNLSQVSILSTQPCDAAQGERKLLPPALRDA